MRLYRPWFFLLWLYPEALFRIKTEFKILYLSFDDGPDPESTPEILSLLDNYGIKAVFFCSGLAAQKYPDLIDAIKLDGHIVGNHGYSHYDGWKTPTGVYCDDIKRASEFTSGSLFRPPYGHLTLKQYAILKKFWKIVFWDIMPYDFDADLGKERSLFVLNRYLRNGSIIVLHDTKKSLYREFLDDFLKGALKNGYQFGLPI
jgi:peptidoglycan-N-acetylglucosamine deacetylase